MNNWSIFRVSELTVTVAVDEGSFTVLVTLSNAAAQGSPMLFQALAPFGESLAKNRRGPNCVPTRDEPLNVHTVLPDVTKSGVTRTINSAEAEGQMQISTDAVSDDQIEFIFGALFMTSDVNVSSLMHHLRCIDFD